MSSLPVIVGITGASGVIYGRRLLEVLRDLEIESHLILSEAARQNLLIEGDCTPEEVIKLAARVYQVSDLAAAVSSGSFRTAGMIIAPCTIKTLSGIANSFNYNLMIRAADVCLKERRPLVLMVRETPLHAGHLRLMSQVADVGGIILPPVPAFYTKPQSLQDIVDHSVGKALDILGIEHQLYKRWS